MSAPRPPHRPARLGHHLVSRDCWVEVLQARGVGGLMQRAFVGSQCWRPGAEVTLGQCRPPRRCPVCPRPLPTAGGPSAEAVSHGVLAVCVRMASFPQGHQSRGVRATLVERDLIWTHHVCNDATSK